MSTHPITLDYGLQAAAACQQAGITDPETELTALGEFADAAEEHREAQLAHEANMAAWRRFAASNAHDDAAHSEHHNACQSSRQVLIGTQHELDTALIRLHTVRGTISAPSGVTYTERVSQAKKIVSDTATAPATRFTILQDGSIHDSKTSLIWANVSVMADNWASAKSMASNLHIPGSPGGWRLPECDELLTLVDRSRHNPACHPGFNKIIKTDDWYWTNTASAGAPGDAWFVYFSRGYSSLDLQDYTGYVLAVRSGPSQ